MPKIKSGPQSAFFLSPNEIHARYATPEDFNDEAIQQKFRSWLSETERASLKALRFEHDRLTYLVAHALLRAALSSYTDIKPADWQFQTKGMVALALTRVGPVGIDVESTSREQNISEIALDILTSNEYFDLNQQAKTDQHTRLLKYWQFKHCILPSGHILALAHHHPEALHAQVSLNEALWLQETANLG